MLLVISLAALLVLLVVVDGSSKTQPHSNQGILVPYDGKHIPYEITSEQNKQLEAGNPVSDTTLYLPPSLFDHHSFLVWQVTINERSGSSGRGIVIQDIAAPPSICMDRIRDLPNYNKFVPKGDTLLESTTSTLY